MRSTASRTIVVRLRGIDVIPFMIAAVTAVEVSEEPWVSVVVAIVSHVLGLVAVVGHGVPSAQNGSYWVSLGSKAGQTKVAFATSIKSE